MAEHFQTLEAGIHGPLLLVCIVCGVVTPPPAVLNLRVVCCSGCQTWCHLPDDLKNLLAAPTPFEVLAPN